MYKHGFLFTMIAIVSTVAFTVPVSLQAEGQGKGGCMGKNMPVVADWDQDEDGFLSEAEFSQGRSERMAQMAQEGRKMKGASNMPSFRDIDSDGDGLISDDEFEAHKQEHRAQMQKNAANSDR
jgi:hypothetical protein